MLLVIMAKTAHQGIAVRAVTQAFRVGLVGPVLQAIAVTQAHQVIMVKTGYQAIVVRVVTLATPVFLVTRVQLEQEKLLPIIILSLPEI